VGNLWYYFWTEGDWVPPVPQPAQEAWYYWDHSTEDAIVMLLICLGGGFIGRTLVLLLEQW
jgi:hypothetical protein